ncbi:hypothetical protein FNW02_14810 [Komarekiella sp. 'clone 1']|uniref:Uncharacterized protein n=1 Tax=Komarekiella delphini-convector SJRDD-AB1 TaxID=2593771 RepID=A0AA40VRD7_9NOST|nr:hypothetical protein [Komarekiella delphini-convector SJRDD-AB1]
MDAPGLGTGELGAPSGDKGRWGLGTRKENIIKIGLGYESTDLSSQSSVPFSLKAVAKLLCL